MNELMISDINSYNGPKLGKQVAKILKKECGPFLSYKEYLYRGVGHQNRTDTAFFKDDGFVNRMPVSVTTELNNVYNKAAEIVGSPIRRENATFAYTEESNADGYGTVFYLFPVGKFDILFNTQIYDLIDVDHDRDDLGITVNTSEEEFAELAKEEAKQRLLHEILIRLNMKPANKTLSKQELFQKAVTSVEELKTNGTYQEELQKYIDAVKGFGRANKIDFEKFLNEFGPHFETDLGKIAHAHRNRSEILLKANEFYYVRVNFFQYFVEEHLW